MTPRTKNDFERAKELVLALSKEGVEFFQTKQDGPIESCPPCLTPEDDENLQAHSEAVVLHFSTWPIEHQPIQYNPWHE